LALLLFAVFISIVKAAIKQRL